MVRRRLRSARRRKFFATKRAADDWLNTRIEVKAGIHTPDADSIIVKEAARLWLQACNANGRERGTVRTYEHTVRSTSSGISAG